MRVPANSESKDKDERTATATTPWDVAIVGGGPAGLSASLWLARYLHTVLLVDSGDPRNWETRGVNGFLGHPGIRPSELRGLGRDEARKHGAELVDAVCDTVTQRSEDSFELVLADGATHRARRLLLAIGLKDVWPDIPGLEHVYGANAHVCPDCDGRDCAEKKVVVIGKGRKAVGMALNLTTWTREIIICTNGEPADLDLPEYCQKLDALNIPVIEAPITCVRHNGTHVHALDLDGGMSLDTDKIFLAVGQYPADEIERVHVGAAVAHAGDGRLDHRDIERVELLAVLRQVEIRRLAIGADDDLARPGGEVERHAHRLPALSDDHDFLV